MRGVQLGTLVLGLTTFVAVTLIAIPTPASINAAIEPKESAIPQSAFSPFPQTAYVFPDAPAIRPYQPTRAVPPPPKSEPAQVIPKPTPKPIVRLRPSVASEHPIAGRSIVGVATWYCLTGVSGCMFVHPGGLYAAAGPALRAALGGGDHCAVGPHCWRDRIVTVRNGPLRVTVTLADWCACGGGHVIDLYSDAMKVIDPGYRTNGGVHAALISW